MNSKKILVVLLIILSSRGSFAQVPELVFDMNTNLVNQAPSNFRAFDSTYFLFETKSQAEPYGIWISNGTTAGTVPFSVLEPLLPKIQFQHISLGDNFIIRRNNGSQDSTMFCLLTSDPWEIKPILAPNGQPFYSVSYPLWYNNKVYFTAKQRNAKYYDVWELAADDSIPKMLFKSDSLNPITSAKIIYPCENGLIIQHSAVGTGIELFKIDTTLDSFVLVKDLIPGSGSGGSIIYHYQNGRVFLKPYKFQKTEIWSCDGSDIGTELFFQDSVSGNPQVQFVATNDSITSILIGSSQNKLYTYNSKTKTFSLKIEKSPTWTDCQLSF